MAPTLQFITLSFLFCGYTLAQQLPSCDVSGLSLPLSAQRAFDAASESTKAVLLGLIETTYTCSPTREWSATAEQGVLFDLSCLATENSADFGELTDRALPIFRKHRSSPMTLQSELSQLIGHAPVQAGSFGFSGSGYVIDLHQSYGTSLQSSAKSVVLAPSGSSSRAWARLSIDHNDFGARHAYLVLASGLPGQGRCAKSGQKRTALYAAQIWIQGSDVSNAIPVVADLPISSAAHEPSPSSALFKRAASTTRAASATRAAFAATGSPSSTQRATTGSSSPAQRAATGSPSPTQSNINAVISAQKLQSFCLLYNAKTVYRTFSKVSSTTTSVYSTTTVLVNPSAQVVTRTSTLTQYTDAIVPTAVIPSPLQSFHTLTIRSGCSAAAPTPSTVTITSMRYGGVATAYVVSTRTVNAASAPPVRTAIAYTTVTRPRKSGAVMLVGDSSMDDTRNATMAGWGSYGWGFPLFTPQPVLPFIGRGCAASVFMERPQWTALLQTVREGDTVVFGFGIMDSGQPIAKLGTSIFVNPMKKIIDTLKAQTPGLTFIISAPMPFTPMAGSWVNGVYRIKYLSGSVDYDWPGLARDTAKQLGVLYVDHTHAVASTWQRLGQAAVVSIYKDNKHTDATGAYLSAEAFSRALQCSNAASAIQLGPAGQLAGPFCSNYGVSPPK